MAKQKTLKRRRSRALRGLGAVEGEKTEYFLPASIVNALGGGDAIAFCAKNVELYIPSLEYKALLADRKATRSKNAQAHYADPGMIARYGERYAELFEKKAKGQARSAKLGENKGNAFRDMAAEIRRDVAAIRAQGITGPIPACVYRTTGKWGERLETAEKRATVHHERFHADARRMEYKLGVSTHSCDDGIIKAMEPLLDKELVDFSRRYWSPHGKAAGEEVLARAEEVIHACDASSKDCSEVLGRVNDWFLSKKQPQLAQSFVEAVAGVKMKHGRPIDAFAKACKVK